MLVANDQSVADVNRQFAAVTDYLADDREDLADAITNLGDALAIVDDFIARQPRQHQDQRRQPARPHARCWSSRRTRSRSRCAWSRSCCRTSCDAYNAQNNTIDGRGNLNETSIWSDERPDARSRPPRAARAAARRGERPMRRVAAYARRLGLRRSRSAGCGLLSGGVYETPLPGGADVGSEPVHITADFEDVLDLVPQSSVKVDNVSVGRVPKITLNKDGRSARVELVVNRSAELPAGTTARLQQTSLLGEKYVGLVRPEPPPSRRSASGRGHDSASPTPRRPPRSSRCSVRCRWCSTAAASASSRRSPASCRP